MRHNESSISISVLTIEKMPCQVLKCSKTAPFIISVYNFVVGIHGGKDRWLCVGKVAFTATLKVDFLSF